MPETYTPEDVEKARTEFPKLDKDLMSHAETSPDPRGGLRITGEFSDQDYRVRPLVVEATKKVLVENDRDERILQKALEKMDADTPPEHKQALTDVVSSFENGGSSFLGEAKVFLRSKASNITRAKDVEQQAKSELAGMLGEKLNTMFGLQSEQVATVYGGKVLESLPSVAVVETGELLQSKAFLAKLRLAIEEEMPSDERDKSRTVFRPAVRGRGYPVEDLKKAINYDSEVGGYKANPTVLNPDSRAVVRVLREVNNSLDRPDGVLLERIQERNGQAVLDPNERPIGTAETKAYYPWEVDEMAKLTSANPNRGEIGGVSEDGLNLAIGLDRQRNYVENLAPWGI